MKAQLRAFQGPCSVNHGTSAATSVAYGDTMIWKELKKKDIRSLFSEESFF